MSYVRAVIRQCAVAALRKDTWAASNVYDSNNAPLVEGLIQAGATQEGREVPYIVVFTDADNHTDVTDGIHASTRNLNLILELGMASAITITTEGGPELKQLHFPYTDPSMELFLDIVEAQSLDAVYGDPRSEWGEIIRLLTVRCVRINSPRGGRTEKGVRYAARQVTLTLDVDADPIRGYMLNSEHPIKRYFELARVSEDEELADAATLLESSMSAIAYPSWQQAQAWLGLTRRGVRSLSIAPLADLAPGATIGPKEGGAPITDDHGEGPITTEIGLEDIPPDQPPPNEETPIVKPHNIIDPNAP
jgi:hypothetical protein